MKVKHYLLILSLALSLCGCKDELELPWVDDVPAGLPATLTLRYSVPTPDAKSRADITADDYVDDLWVGVFSVAPENYGKLTYSKTFYRNPSAGQAQLPDEGCGNELQITPPSGESIIVGIANAGTNMGIVEGSATGSRRLVADIIADWQVGVTTLDDYMRLAAIPLTDEDEAHVDAPGGNYVMSGTYTTLTDPPQGPHKEELFPDADWGNPAQLPGRITIYPGDNTGTGGFLRLCRHVASTKFNIGTTVPDMEITPVQWQVFDVPQLSLMGERTSVNGGDILNALGHPPFANSEPKPASSFGSALMSTAAHPGRFKAHTFSFFTFNNRRTGLDHVTTYAERDREFKKADGTNTGVFTSLVPSYSEGAAVSSTGRSPYVRVRLNLEYYVSGDYDDPADPMPAVSKDTPGAVLRHAEIMVTVHLGYCDGNTTQEKAKDFNVHRNTRYTYNLTVNGVNDVRVEAISKTDENNPSLEGTVNDTDQRFINLDAHYNVFNISLTNHQRKTLHYSIRTPFGVEAGGSAADVLTFASDRNANGQIHELTPQERAAMWNGKTQFRDWIRIVPTTGQNVLAPYPGDENQCGYGQHQYWTLDDFLDWENHKGFTPGTETESTQDNETCYYTVFVDEYVYPNDENGNPIGAQGWTKYVNHTNGRTCTLRVQPEWTSQDKHSVYSHSIIYIQQNSIQTFYAVQASDGVGSATIAENPIGIERRNETYGLNMLWEWGHAGDSYFNGRYNAWQYLNLSANSNISWSDYVNQSASQYVGTVSQYARFGLPDLEPRNEPLPALVPSRANDAGNAYHQWFPSPADPKVYEVMTLFLSRNRDLNGNGKIDKNEIRWVIPSEYQMQMIVVGAPTLGLLVDYNNNKGQLAADGWDNESAHAHHDAGNDERQNGPYHYITSSGTMLWADQHMVHGGTNEVLKTYDGNHPNNTRGHYWQVRCVRILGSEDWDTHPLMTKRDYTKAISAQWNADTSTGRVSASYLNRRNVRAGVNTPIAYHSVSDVSRNTSSRAFFYTSPRSVTIPDRYPATDAGWAQYLTENNPAADLNGTKQWNGRTIRQGWRVATFQELALIFLLSSHGAFESMPDGSGWWGGRTYSCSKEEFLNPNRTLGVMDGKLNSLKDHDSRTFRYIAVCDDIEGVY